MFYILYANKEHLSYKEIQRCISNQTYTALLGSKDNMSKGLLEAYPNAPVMFKDTLFVDFLNLLKKHSESRDVKRSNENPSIGIILCPETDRVVVEYAMSGSMSPTMIAEYKRILIPQERMQQQLNEFCNLFLNKD